MLTGVQPEGTIVVRPASGSYRIEITRRDTYREYWLADISAGSASRLCAILNRLRSTVDWNGYEPVIYYFASEQEEDNR